MKRRTKTKEAVRGMVAMILLALVALGAGAAGAADSSPRPSKLYSSRALASEAATALAAGHPGRAVLAYERAALTSPTPAISEGLARARAAAGLPPHVLTLAELATGRLGANGWAWIGMSGLLLGAVGVGAFGWGFLRRRGFVFVLVSAASVTAIGLLTAQQGSPPPDRAVVVASKAVARIAPFAKADESFAPPEGSEATIERTHGDFTLISTPEGEGWVPHDAVETIVPSNAHHS